MTDEQERDDLVGGALGSLPTPEHLPGFWERLDAGFDEIDHERATETTSPMSTTQTPPPPVAGPAPAGAPGSAPVHDLDAARRSPGRRARLGRRYQALSAAAAVALVVAGIGFLNSDGGDGGKDVPVAGRSVGDSELDAVEAFQEALTGDDAALWAVLGPLTKARIGSQDNVGATFRSGEGVRPFKLAPRRQWRTYPVDGQPTGAVVVAPIADDADSLLVPVVRVDGRWLVEFDANGSSGPPPVMVSRSARQPGEPVDIPIEVSADERSQLYGRLDGEGDFTRLEHAGNGLFRFDQKLSDLAEGDHTLDVISRGPDWFFVSTVDLSGRTTPSTATGQPVGSEARSVVAAWNQAIADGDADRAWELMGPLSRTYLTGQGGWESLVAEVAEGAYAAWSRQDVAYGYVDLPDGQSGVVTASGTLELEGNQEYRTDAWPVVRQPDGSWKVEQFAFGPGDTAPEWLHPSAGQNGLSGIQPGDEVSLLAPGEAFLSVDGGRLTKMSLDMADRPGPAGRWTYKPQEPFKNGTHLFVVVTKGDGYFTGLAYEVAVEG